MQSQIKVFKVGRKQASFFETKLFWTPGGRILTTRPADFFMCSPPLKPMEYPVVFFYVTCGGGFENMSKIVKMRDLRDTDAVKPKDISWYWLKRRLKLWIPSVIRKNVAMFNKNPFGSLIYVT